MKVYRGLKEFSAIKNAIVTTGTFDGVHIGHQTILSRLKEIAKKNNGESVLLTFYPHPRMVLQPDFDLKLLNTIDEKIELLKLAGLNHLIIEPFTKAFSRTTSLEYVRDILVNKIGTTKLVIGYDHHFGRNREGSFDHLKEYGPLYGFQVEEISAQEIEEVNVSSTKIRKALERGDVKTANQYLGYSYQLTGLVVTGQQLGRTLGYPTANLKVEAPYKLIPANGIYAVYVKHNEKTYQGVLNIGIRPTIENASGEVSIEVHIFDFNHDIYNDSISVQLMERIRSEQKFQNLQELQAALKVDKEKASRLLK